MRYGSAYIDKRIESRTTKRTMAMAAVLLFLGPVAVHANGDASGQSYDNAPRIEIELEPIPFVLGGAGITVGYRVGSWRYAVEAYGLNMPEALHGNEGFEVGNLGLELHVERFFGDRRSGFYAGPDIAIGRLNVTHRESGATEKRLNFSVGVRGGYQWYPGLGDLYISPLGGVMYTVNTDEIELSGDTFESGPITPFATIGAGWTFGL